MYATNKVFSKEYRLAINTLPQSYIDKGITPEYIRNEISILVKQINTNEASINPTKYKSSDFKFQQTPPLRVEFRGNAVFLNETISAIRKLLGNEKSIEINIQENDNSGIRCHFRLQSDERIYIAEDYYNYANTITDLKTLILDQAVAIVAQTNPIQLFSYVADNINFVHETNLLEIENNLSNNSWYVNLSIEDKLRVHMYYGQLFYDLNSKNKAFKHFKTGFLLASVENLQDSQAYQELLISYSEYLNIEGRAKETIKLLSNLKVKYNQDNFKYSVLGDAYSLLGEERMAEETWSKLRSSKKPITQTAFIYGMNNLVRLFLSQNRFSEAEKLISQNSLDKAILGLFSTNYTKETDNILKQSLIKFTNGSNTDNKVEDEVLIEETLKFFIYKNEYPKSNRYLLGYLGDEKNISIYQIRDYYNKYINKRPDDYLTRYLFEEKLIRELRKSEDKDSTLYNHAVKLFDTLMLKLPHSPTVPLLGMGLIHIDMEEKQVYKYLGNLKASSSPTVQSIGNIMELTYNFDYSDYDNAIAKLDSIYYEIPAFDTLTNTFIKNFRSEQFADMLNDSTKTLEDKKVVLFKMLNRYPDDYDLYIELVQLYDRELSTNWIDDLDMYPSDIFEFMRGKFPKKPDPILSTANSYFKNFDFPNAYTWYNEYIYLKAKPIDSFYNYVYTQKDTIKFLELEEYEENFLKSYFIGKISDTIFFNKIRNIPSSYTSNLQKIANLYTQKDFNRKRRDIHLDAFYATEDNPIYWKISKTNKPPLYFLLLAVMDGFNLNDLDPIILEKYKDNSYFINVIQQEYLKQKK